MEAIIGILGPIIEVGKCIGGPIKRHFNYLCCFNNNIPSLREEARKLKDANEGLQIRVDSANNNVEVIYPEVVTWLETASQNKDIINAIENDIPEVKKGCLNLISRYSLSKKAKRTADAIRELRNNCQFHQISQDAPPPSMRSLPLGPKEEFETRKKIEEDVMAALRDRNTNVIGLCGMGGIGKTSMAERIMGRVKEEKLFDEVLMVVVSQEVKLLNIQQDIAKQLGLTLEDELLLSARAQKIYARLTAHPKRIFLVIDDVWGSLHLKDIGIPSGNTSGMCTILVTSRDRSVLNTMETQRIFEIGVLPEREAWLLFRKKTGSCVDRDDLCSVAEDVAKECNGLPLALVTVGLALRDKTSRPLWDNVLVQLRSSNPEDLPRVLSGVYKPLKLSYEFLENPRAKCLFLLCSMFKEDSDIGLDILTCYGIGLGMFGELRNLNEARNRTLGLVEMLKDGSLLLDGFKKNCVRMHDVVRDMAIHIASKEHRCGFVINDDYTLIDWASQENICKDFPWISIFNLKFPVEVKFPSLRLLRLERGEELSDKFFDEIREINVLSMTSIQIESFPPTTQLLKNLKTLFLFECGIESISVVGEFSKLEVLCCRRCHNIKALPMEIGRLNHLRLLEITSCRNFSTIVPGVISSLVSLEELVLRSNGFDAIESSPTKNVVFVELESLTRLTRFEIDTCDLNLVAEEICFPPKVEKYYIQIAEKRMYFPELPTSFYNWLHLEIREEMKVANWIQKLLRDTKFLYLEGDGANQVNYTELGNVKSLFLGSCSSVKKLVNTTEIDNSGAFHFFENLRKLQIVNCPQLRYLFPVSMAIRSNLPQLEELRVDGCEAMEDIFYKDDDDDDKMEKDGKGHRHYLRLALPKLRSLILGNIPRFTAPQILNKIVAPSLETLRLRNFKENISSEWCSFSFFNNLVILDIASFNGIKNLMSSLVARNLLCLRELQVNDCDTMLEVIADDEEQQIDKISLFPALSTLSLWKVPDLRSFCQLKQSHTLEMTSLEYVSIRDCPKMETFTLGSLCAPNLKRVVIEFWRCTKIEDLNEAIQRYVKLKDKFPRKEDHMSYRDYAPIVSRFMETESSPSQKS